MADLYVAVKRFGKALTGQNIKGSNVADLINDTADKLEKLNKLDETQVEEALTGKKTKK